METFLNNVQYGLRRLRRSVWTTLTVVLTLAIGIGGLAAAFSAVDAVLLRPLPYQNPDGLISVHEHIEHDNHALRVTAPDAIALERESKFSSSLGTFVAASYEATGLGAPFEAKALRATTSVFTTLGIPPQLGRPFTQQEDDNNAAVAVVSYALWKDRLHKDANVLGSLINLDRKPYTIVGVMPPSFDFPLDPGSLAGHDVWIPMSLSPAEKESEGNNFDFGVVARRRPGLSDEAIQQDMNRVIEQTQARFPGRPGMPRPKISASFIGLKDETVQKARPILHFLCGAVAVLMLIVNVNFANLLLVQGAARKRELGIRQALGADRSTIFGQLLMESMLLSVMGGALGTLLAVILVRAAPAFLPDYLARLPEIHLSWNLLLCCVALILLTGLACGVASGAASLRSDLLGPLQASGRLLSSSRSHRRSRDILVTLEVCLAMVLLVASSLLLRSFANVLTVDPGFQPDHVLTAAIALPEHAYPTQQDVDSFLGELQRRLTPLSVIEAVGFSTDIPVTGMNSGRLIAPEGYTKAANETLTLAGNYLLQGNYFSALNIPLLKGRYLTTADEQTGAPLVVVISKALAGQYFQGKDPIGMHIKIGPSFDAPTPAMTVVGVVGDVKQAKLDEPVVPEMYQPLSQSAASLGPFGAASGVSRNLDIVVRTHTAPAAFGPTLENAIHELDPLIALTDMRTMDMVITTTESSRRFNTITIATLAAIALFLALVGIYGVTAYTVMERTSEIAVRIALGATQESVLWLTLKYSIGLVSAGIVAGLVASYGVASFTQSILYDTSSVDPLMLLGASVAMLVCATFAAWIPGRHAAVVEPMKILRKEY
jgi:predicted permease